MPKLGQASFSKTHAACRRDWSIFDNFQNFFTAQLDSASARQSALAVEGYALLTFLTPLIPPHRVPSDMESAISTVLYRSTARIRTRTPPAGRGASKVPCSTPCNDFSYLSLFESLASVGAGKLTWTNATLLVINPHLLLTNWDMHRPSATAVSQRASDRVHRDCHQSHWLLFHSGLRNWSSVSGLPPL